MAMEQVIIMRAESDRSPDNHLPVIVAVVKNPEPVKISHPHPQKLVLTELFKFTASKRKDKPGIGQKRRHVLKRLFFNKVAA